MTQNEHKNPPDNIRCAWVTSDPLYIDYHDNEWGIPVRDNHKLFEFLILEGAQAGLSWITVLKKRENYRACFDHFDPYKIADYEQQKINELITNPGIIRNRLKIEAAITNAKAYIQLTEQGIDFSEYLWSFVNNKPIINHWDDITQIPAQTDTSSAMSKGLKSHGFKFTGSTICYAFMQAVGMVNDHTINCISRTLV